MKKSLSILVALFAAFASVASAAQITFIGTSGADLTNAALWNGGAVPGEADTAFIDLGNGAITALSIPSNMTLGGIVLTNTGTVAFSGAGTLSLGTGGLTVYGTNTSRSVTFNMLTAITTAQKWDLGSAALKLATNVTGTAEWTLNAVAGGTVAAPGYGGKMVYTQLSATYQVTKSGQWANEVNLASRSGTRVEFFIGSTALPFKTMFPSGVFTSSSSGLNLLFENSSAMTMAADDSWTFRGGAQFTIDSGMFTQNGGTMDGSNVQVGYADFNAVYTVASGTLSTDYLYIGNGGKISTATQSFIQKNGNVSVANYILGGWAGTSYQALKKYEIDGGTLSLAKASGSDGGIHLGWNRTGNMNNIWSVNPDSSFAFIQKGGTVATPQIVMGRAMTTMGQLTNSSDLVKLTGGTLTMGSGGLYAGSTWNNTVTGCTYRVKASGGTIGSASSWSSSLALDLIGSGTVTLDTAANQVALNAPVRGSANLVKTGSGTLALGDAQDLTGSLDIQAGQVRLMQASAATAAYARWVADDVSAGQAYGASVSTWTDRNLGIVASNGWNGASFAAPQYYPDMFNGHAGLYFGGGSRAFIVPPELNPVAGQTNFSVVVVFRTSAGGNGDQTYPWYNCSGLVGFEQPTVVNDWGVAYNGAGQLVGGFGVLGGSDQTFRSDVSYPLKDNTPHVGIYTVSGAQLVLNVDGRAVTQNAGFSGSKPRNSVQMYIGMHDPGNPARTFPGEIAELRIYPDYALTADEQDALGCELAAKYGVAAAVFTQPTAAQAGNVAEIVPETAEFDTVAAAWDADTLNASLADGASVSAWPSADGARSATLAAATSLDGGGAIAGRTAPVLAKNVLNGHSVVRFGGGSTVLAIPAANSPVSGSTNFTCAVVIRTTTDGVMNSNQHFWCARGLLDTEEPGMNRGDWGVAFAADGRPIVGLGGLNNVSTDQSLFAKPFDLNDGMAHSIIYTLDQTGGKMHVMVDGFLTSRVISIPNPLTPRDAVRVLIGSVNGGNYFVGDIAAVRLYGTAMTAAEMAALAKAFAAEYGISAQPVGNIWEPTRFGIGCKAIGVASGARLILPLADARPFTLAAGQGISGEGNVAGSLGIGSGCALDFGVALPTVEDLWLTDGSVLSVPAAGAVSMAVGRLRANGTVTVAVTGDRDSLPPSMPLFTYTGAVAIDGAVWKVTGGFASSKIRIDATAKTVNLVTPRGMSLRLD